MMDIYVVNLSPFAITRLIIVAGSAYYYKDCGSHIVHDNYTSIHSEKKAKVYVTV